MLSHRAPPLRGREARCRLARLGVLAAPTLLVLLWRSAAVGFAAAGHGQRITFHGARRGGLQALRPLSVRLAAPQIPLDELAPDEVIERSAQASQQVQQVIPRLPGMVDVIFGGMLYVFPFLVLISWASFTYLSYQASKEAKERDEKRKIKKAIQVDGEFSADIDELEEMDRRKKKRRRKPTAFEESIALEEEAKSKSRSAY
mmetsp:Transcript_22693/g.51892  ORF Transcript_22693/g.51892 Transcript_22693/m.51892 type:complete len:202 (+) Transcript_22693:31-636(+)